MHKIFLWRLSLQLDIFLSLTIFKNRKEEEEVQMMWFGSCDLLLFDENKTACFMMTNAYHVFLIFYLHHNLLAFWKTELVLNLFMR